MSQEPQHYEVIIVGGSFAGLSAATGIARMNRSVLIIDSGHNRNRFASHVHNFAGFEGMSPADVLNKMRETTYAYPFVHGIKGTVVKIENLSVPQKGADREKEKEIKFRVTVDHGETYECKRVILATGVVDELADIKGVKELWGVGVAHCPHCHGYEVSNKRIGFLRTQNPMLGVFPKMLRELSPKIDIVFFTDGVKLDEKERIQWVQSHVVIEERRIDSLVGDPERHLKRIQFDDGSSLELDCLFIAGKCHPHKLFVDQLGLEMDMGPSGQYYKTNPMTKETSVKGVYACGDTARPSHQTTFAVSDGVLAGFMCHLSLIM